MDERQRLDRLEGENRWWRIATLGSLLRLPQFMPSAFGSIGMGSEPIRREMIANSRCS